MIRLVHTLCATLLVAVALIAYGVKEETRALQREIEAVERETERVAREIDALETEWAYLNSPRALRRIATALYGRDGLVGVDGGALEPWAAAQVQRLTPLAPTAPFTAESVAPLLAAVERDLPGLDPALDGAGGIATGTIPAPEPAQEVRR